MRLRHFGFAFTQAICPIVVYISMVLFTCFLPKFPMSSSFIVRNRKLAIALCHDRTGQNLVLRLQNQSQWMLVPGNQYMDSSYLRAQFFTPIMYHQGLLEDCQIYFCMVQERFSFPLIICTPSYELSMQTRCCISLFSSYFDHSIQKRPKMAEHLILHTLT